VINLNYNNQYKFKISYHLTKSYNNEWMIIDYNRFNPGEPLKKGLLTVLEQLPGLIEWQDKTDVLAEDTYWSSYNIP
jgi:hypothetical protein